MSSRGWNPHKQGEHVFNDIGASLSGSFRAAMQTDRAKPLVLSDQFGSLELDQLPQTVFGLSRFQRNPILLQARTIVAPPSGLQDDRNSKVYGWATSRLEEALSNLFVRNAALSWIKKPIANSSFQNFEEIVTGMRDASSLKAEAMAAVDLLVISAHDPEAEASALSERVSDSELARRRAVIESVKQHQPAFKQEAHFLVDGFADELSRALEDRISRA